MWKTGEVIIYQRKMFIDIHISCITLRLENIFYAFFKKKRVININ